MPLYTNWNHANPAYVPNAADIASWAGTWGHAIMQAAGAAGTVATTPAGMDALVGHFQARPWTWNPGAPGRGLGPGRRWLDYTNATAQAGECGFIAWALHTLLITPAPYGFGIASGNCPVREYSGLAGAGAGGWGFISPHAALGHHNLGPNVADPAAAAVLANFYSWADHVVVEHHGRFYDPSYNVSYAAITDMAAFRCATPAVVDFRPATGQLARQMNPPAGAAAVWFRTRQVADAAYHAGCHTIGPFAANPLPAVVAPPPAPPVQAAICCAIL